VFGREKPTKVSPVAPVSKIETIIGPNAHFQGDIQSDGGMRVDGIFEGNIDIAGNLVIGEAAKVIAEVSANNISISGAVKGNIAGNRVEILETGRVWGDLTINSLLLNEGAYLRGHTTMHSDIEPPLIEASKTRSTAEPAGPQPAAVPPGATIVDVEPRPQTGPRVGE
jgi:cytoskeletal protein CcmA (bactofilin family)